MMKSINYIWNWAVSSGFLLAAVIFLWSYLRPFLEQKRKSAKTAQEKELLGVVESLADTAVSALSGRDDLGGSEKFSTAIKTVKSSLSAKGLSASEGTIQTAVQSAYEKSPLTGTDSSSQSQDGLVVSKGNDPVLRDIVEAPNRANTVGGD